MSTMESDGSQTATISTEHTLFTFASGHKSRILKIDGANLAASETVVLRVYSPVRTGGTIRLIKAVPFTGVLAEPNCQLPPLDTYPTGYATLQQQNGTGRVFEWEVVTLD